MRAFSSNREERLMSNPTEEQVEAAAKALRDDHANRVDGWKVPEWENLQHGFKIEYRGKARAALVAAAGAAPQASSDHAELASEVLKLATKRRNKGDQYARYPEYVCFSDRYYAEAEVMRQASVALAAPVQVDEAKLAQVIRDSYANEQGLKIRDDLRTAEAVAEWLRVLPGAYTGE